MNTNLEAATFHFSLHGPKSYLHIFSPEPREQENLCHMLSIDSMGAKAGWVDAWCVPGAFQSFRKNLLLTDLAPYLRGTYKQPIENISCSLSNSLEVFQYRWKTNSTLTEKTMHLTRKVQTCLSEEVEAPPTSKELLKKETLYDLGLPPDTSGKDSYSKTISKIYTHSATGLCQSLTLIHKGPDVTTHGHCLTEKKGNSTFWYPVYFTQDQPTIYCKTVENTSTFDLIFHIPQSYPERADVSALIQHRYIPCESIPDESVTSSCFVTKPNYVALAVLSILAAFMAV